MSWNTRTPIASTCAGSSVFGPITRTSGVPSVVRPWISERATRECRTSPTIATVRLWNVLLVVADRVEVEQPLRRVRVAAVAGVDHVHVRCGAWRSRCCAMRCGAPDCAWRTTKMSASIATRLSTVSSSVSPLLVDEAPMLRLMTSADSRFAAISNVVRVRVEFSKNRLNTALPRSSGTFFTSRSAIDTNGSAVSRMPRMTSGGRPSSVSRCVSSPLALSCGLRVAMPG